MNCNKINTLKIGDTGSYEKIITEEDVVLFSQISGDKNPVHLDEKIASKSIFKTRVAHGMLTASLISAVIGTVMPGEGTIYLEQNIRFLKPVKLGEKIKAIVTVVNIDENKNRVFLQTDCFNESKKRVIEGTAVVIPPERNV